MRFNYWNAYLWEVVLVKGKKESAGLKKVAPLSPPTMPCSGLHCRSSAHRPWGVPLARAAPVHTESRCVLRSVLPPVQPVHICHTKACFSAFQDITSMLTVICEHMQVLSNASICKFPLWILVISSSASCHQVRTFSSSYAPFFAVRQQTLSAISKCALACRGTREMHTHAKVHMISAVPKGTWKAASLVAFSIWTCCYWWYLENRGKTCYKERTLFKVPYPAAPNLSLGSSKAPHHPASTSHEAPFCPPENEVLVCSVGHLWIFRPSLIPSSVFCLISGPDPATTFCSAWDHVTWGSPEQQKL